MLRQKSSPELIDLPTEAFEEIQSRISSSALLEEDKKIVLIVLGTYSWLMSQLQSTKLTIHRLKKMFGFSTEKRNKLKSKGTQPKNSADFTSKGTSASQVLSLDE